MECEECLQILTEIKEPPERLKRHLEELHNEIISLHKENELMKQEIEEADVIEEEMEEAEY